MRILFLTPSVRPLGARRSLVELIRALPADASPMVVCPGKDGIAEELRHLGVPTAYAPQGAWRKLGGRLTACFFQIPRLRRVVTDFRPDVVHANEFHSVPQAASALRGAVPLCGHVRLTITPRQIQTYQMAACERVVAVSEAVRGLFEGSGMEHHVRVVYNGVAVDRIRAEGEPQPEAKSWRILSDRYGSGESGEKRGKMPVVFGLLGLVSERKNQLLAVEAVARARASGANVALLLAGDAFKGSEAYGEALRRRVEAPDVRDAVLWLPFQQDPAPLYRTLDVNLLISNEEGFGRTIIEAAAAGRPSLGAPTGGIPELIQQDRTGWVLPRLDVEALAAALVSIWEQREHLLPFGEAARLRTLEHFTIQAHVRAMMRLWEEAREAHRARG